MAAGAQGPTLRILKRRAEFLAVAQKGKKWVTPSFIIQYAATPADAVSAGQVRYGLTASAKSGNAVARNRAKRRLRELVKEVLLPNAKTEHDYVLIARIETAKRDYADLKKDLLWALKKTGMLA